MVPGASPCANWISQKKSFRPSGRPVDRWKGGRVEGVGIHDFTLLIRAAAGPQDAREQFPRAKSDHFSLTSRMLKLEVGPPF